MGWEPLSEQPADYNRDDLQRRAGAALDLQRCFRGHVVRSTASDHNSMENVGAKVQGGEGSLVRGAGTTNGKGDLQCNGCWDLCLWRPTLRDIFGGESSLRHELRNEAALVIQQWWRKGRMGEAGHATDSECDENSSAKESSGDSCEDNDGNSATNCPENVAVRRAFLTSVTSCHHRSSAGESGGNEEAQMTMEQISSWMDDAISSALAPDVRRIGARIFWRKWEDIAKSFPEYMRIRLVQSFDQKLQTLEFPSLRELVRQQDGE